MTRFARAKGSKSSNERLPNEATPWHIMKQQLEESKNKESLEKKKSVKELLWDGKDRFDINTNGNINQDWAEFDDNRSNMKKHKDKNSNKNDINSTENPRDNPIFKDDKNIEKLQEMEDKKIERTDGKIGKPKKKRINHLNPPSNERELNAPQNDGSNSVVLSKRQKRNLKRKLETSNTEFNKKFKQDTSGRSDEINGKRIKKKDEYKRRKPDCGPTKVIINGMEIEIVMYDRFPVKKEDAERLTELKQKLIMKGIPKSEVDMAIKLERRKAEKALARVKKLVCFNCRKSGHNLSDCPELGQEEACTGICFKCGSTEHTHFECKVNKDSSYRFAKCFICREQGHIAVQCPDNPKGIYPHGGCCKICGAVTHLKKDCPDLVKAKEESTITAEKMDNSTIECLQGDVKESVSNKPKNKIIKF